jgi:hypothetical protein
MKGAAVAYFESTVRSQMCRVLTGLRKTPAWTSRKPCPLKYIFIFLLLSYRAWTTLVQ